MRFSWEMLHPSLEQCGRMIGGVKHKGQNIRSGSAVCHADQEESNECAIANSTFQVKQMILSLACQLS